MCYFRTGGGVDIASGFTPGIEWNGLWLLGPMED